MTMRVTLVIASLFSWAVALLLVVGFLLTRPHDPDFDNPTEWTLIKAGRVPSSSAEVEVYLFNREPAVWDSRDVMQNKIVVRDSGKRYVYMWPSNRDYAAGWCELAASEPGAVAVVLFERDAAVRVVQYSHGRFEFRDDKDELLTTHALRYEDVNRDGMPEFIDSEARQAWWWSAANGFSERRLWSDAECRKVVSPP